jgi:hypothetical protein
MRGISYIGVPFLVVGLLWGALVHGAPSLVNRVFGEEEQVIVTLTKERHVSRRSCDYRLEGQYLGKAFPSHICISKAEFESPPKSVQVMLKGYGTRLGFLIEEVHEQER